MLTEQERQALKDELRSEILAELKAEIRPQTAEPNPTPKPDPKPLPGRPYISREPSVTVSIPKPRTEMPSREQYAQLFAAIRDSEIMAGFQGWFKDDRFAPNVADAFVALSIWGRTLQVDTVRGPQYWADNISNQLTLLGQHTDLESRHVLTACFMWGDCPCTDGRANGGPGWNIGLTFMNSGRDPSADNGWRAVLAGKLPRLIAPSKPLWPTPQPRIIQDGRVLRDASTW